MEQLVQSLEGRLAYLEREIAESFSDFSDPALEWRRLFSELLGTFFLVLVAAGGGMTTKRTH